MSRALTIAKRVRRVSAALALAVVGGATRLGAAGIPATAYLNNPSMSEGSTTPDDWKVGWDRNGRVHVSRDTEVYQQGPASLRIEATGSRARASVGQYLKAVPPGRIAVHGWVRVAGEFEQVTVGFQVFSRRWNLIGFETVASATPTDTWQEFAKELQLPGEAYGANFGVSFRGTGRIWLDEIDIREIGPHVDPEVEAQSVLDSDQVQLAGPKPYRWDTVATGGDRVDLRVALHPRAPGLARLGPAADGLFRRDSARTRPLDLSAVLALPPPLGEDMPSLDFCESDPDFVVLLGGWKPADAGYAGYSTDNGRSWHAFDSIPFPGAKRGRIVVSATNPDVSAWLLPGADQPPYCTRDRGRTWQPSMGAPAGCLYTGSPDLPPSQPLCADRTRPGFFYLYDGRSGRFYRSWDGGLTWRHRATLPRQNGVPQDQHRVLVVPEPNGEAWVTLDAQGLFHSTYMGSAWVRLTGIERAWQLGFGAPALANGTPSAYLLGRVQGDRLPSGAVAVYRSDDAGVTWNRISPPDMVFGPTVALAGDRLAPGRVFVAVPGQGLLVGTEVHE